MIVVVVVTGMVLVVACDDTAGGDDPRDAGGDPTEQDAGDDAAGLTDAASGDGSSSDGGCESGAPCGAEERNRAFITSSTHVLGELGGVAAADAICNARAAVAIGDATSASLGAVLSTPILMEANGTMPSNGVVWTGSGSPAAVSSESCDDWTSDGSASSSALGFSHDGQDWFGVYPSSCNLSFAGRVYCLEE